MRAVRDRPSRALSARTLGALAVVGRRHRLLAQLDPREARRVPRRPRRVLEDGHGQRRVERLPLEHRPAGHDAARAPGVRPRRLLRPEPRHLLRRGDAQQRRQRRADRFALAVPHRADRRRGSSGSTSIRVRWCSRSSRSAASASCCSARRRTATRRCEGNVFGVLAMLLWWRTSCRRGTSAGTWTSPPSWRRSARSRPWPCFRWRSPTATCSG